jgi:hypothetical protein
LEFYHPCRIAIVRTLLAAGKRELFGKEIPLKISNTTRSHHFGVLRDADIILTRSEGTTCMSSLRRRELARRFPGLLKLLVSEDSRRP